jgi:glyoxylase I family protein
MVSGIEHTAIASPDPHKLAQWYVDHLGFVINYQSKKSSTVFVQAPDGSMIEIIESNAPASVAPAMRDPGIRHMALTVADFPAACERLKSQGIPFLAEPQTSGGNSLVFFADCDGNILHLLHREKPLGA